MKLFFLFLQWFKKRYLLNLPKNQDITEKINYLNNLYKEIDANEISHHDRTVLELSEDAYIYGEIDFTAFINLLNQFKTNQHNIFYDLGSGSGKAVFAAALCFDFSKTVGIEKLPGLHQAAINQLAKLQTGPYANKSSVMQFVNEDFLNCDFYNADIIFINATCFSYPMLQNLIHKLLTLKEESCLIVVSKKIDDQHFKLIAHDLVLMSWGFASVNIYEKNSGFFESNLA